MRTNEPGPYQSDGSRKLSDKLSGTTQLAFAALSGISQASLSQYARGWSRPGTYHQHVLRRHARIPLAAWLTDDEQRSIGPHRRTNKTGKRASRKRPTTRAGSAR